MKKSFTIQYWLLLCFNYHLLLLTKICNHSFDFLDFYQISFVPKFTILCLTKVMNLYMYLFSIIFLYSFIIFAKHGFSIYGERSGSTPCSIVQVKMLFDLNSLWFDCVVFRAVLFFKFDVLYFCRFNFWNHYWPTEWNDIWWICRLVLSGTERNH